MRQPEGFCNIFAREIRPAKLHRLLLLPLLSLAACIQVDSRGFNPSSMRGMLLGIEKFARKPMVVNCFQGATVSGVGDLASQTFQQRSSTHPHYSQPRLMSAAATGLVYNGLLLPAYYVALQSRWPSRELLPVLLKTAADSALFGFFGNAGMIALRSR